MKHIPGHGQSNGADPHLGICHVAGDITQDIIPFVENKADSRTWGMTNHVIYDKLDPSNPTAFSSVIVKYIRETIGFKNFLITDAIDMGALNNTEFSQKVTKALSAGHDAILYCGSEFNEQAKLDKNSAAQAQLEKVRVILEAASSFRNIQLEP